MSRNALQRPRWGHEVDFLIVMTAFYVCCGIVIPSNSMSVIRAIIPLDQIFFPLVFALMGFFVLVLPLALMHCSLGQLTQRGAIAVWRVICPLADGFGYTYVAMNVIFTWLIVHYISESIFLLVDSVVHQPPSWMSCKNPWNTRACSMLNDTTPAPRMPWISLRFHIRKSNSLEQFWLFRMYSIKERFHHLILPFGSFSWELALCSLLVWIGTGAGLCLGPRRIAKFVLTLLTIGVVAAVVVAACVAHYSREKGLGSGNPVRYLQYVDTFVARTHLLAWGPLLALASYNAPSTRSNLFTFLALLISIILVVLHKAIYAIAVHIRTEFYKNAGDEHNYRFITKATHQLHDPLSGFFLLPAPGVMTAFWCIHFISILGAGLLTTGEAIIASVLDVVGTHTPRARRAVVLIVCSTGLLVSISSATYYSRSLTFDIFNHLFLSLGMYFSLATLVVIIYNFGVSRLISFWVLMGGHPCAAPILRYLWRPMPLVLLILISLGYSLQFVINEHYLDIKHLNPEWRALKICELIVSLAPSLVLVQVGIWNFVRSPKVAGGLFPRLRQTLRPEWGLHQSSFTLRDAWAWVRIGQRNDHTPTVVTDTATL